MEDDTHHDLYKWERLETWKTKRNIVIPIDATEYEQWHLAEESLHPGRPCIVIEMGKVALVVDVLPLYESGELELHVIGFRDGVQCEETEAIGMSRDKSWSDVIRYPRYAIKIGEGETK